jgi:hypothetical protein
MNARRFQWPAWMATFALLLASLPAQSAIFVQTEPVSGVTILSNVPPRAAATITASRGVKPRVPPATAPVMTSAAAGFPRIARELQQERDVGRSAILRTELETEQQALQAALAQRSAPEVLHRHNGNIAALRRELDGLH